jgi:hypothetical protein
VRRQAQFLKIRNYFRSTRTRGIEGDTKMTDATLPPSMLRRMSQMLAQPGHTAVVASFRLSGPQQT